MKRYTDAIAELFPVLVVGVLVILAVAQYIQARQELDQIKADYSIVK